MRKVKSIRYNWRPVGSLNEGIGDDWNYFEVGKNGVKSIEENEPRNGMQLWNYVVELESGTVYRIFNPNFVEYFPEENESCVKN